MRARRPARAAPTPIPAFTPMDRSNGELGVVIWGEGMVEVVLVLVLVLKLEPWWF